MMMYSNRNINQSIFELYEAMSATNTTPTFPCASCKDDTYIPISRIIVCTLLFATIIITVIGNIMVIISPKFEKKLLSTFVYFVINLAVTDLAVALTAMWFYTVDVLLGYWPFGEVSDTSI